MLEPLIITFDALVKARSTDSSGRRLIECEVSNQEVDLEGDVIEQKALLDSADYFIKYGHIDIDHISELGFRAGIKNPSSYIIGRPTEVKDLGNGRTGMVGEIMKSRDGSVNPEQNKYDEVWKSLQAEPPVMWRASIYGFPELDGVIDCSEVVCNSGATRYHITKLQWKSLALTRNPVNDAIKGCVQIISAKAQIDWLRKDMMMPFNLGETPRLAPAFNNLGQNQNPSFSMPYSTSDLWQQYTEHMAKDCPHCHPGLNSSLSFMDHFSMCCGADPSQSEILANALMWMVTKENVLAMSRQ
jgi:hypothetical protein